MDRFVQKSKRKRSVSPPAEAELVTMEPGHSRNFPSEPSSSSVVMVVADVHRPPGLLDWCLITFVYAYEIGL